MERGNPHREGMEQEEEKVMLVLRSRNVNDAFAQFLRVMQDSSPSGVNLGRVSPRGLSTLEIQDPVTTVYRVPTERVLFDPGRDANPFFHLMESLWMLAGRNDVAFLSEFTSRMAQFSDDGETIRGAYGHRWRYSPIAPLIHGSRDQIKEVVLILNRDPDSRRAVISMWNPALDYPTMTTRDLPCNTHIYFKIREDGLHMTVCCRSNDALLGCLASDTVVLSPEGDISIEKLACKFSDGLDRYPVYSVDESSGDMDLKWCTDAWKTGIKPVVELEFDDGSTLRLTKDHVLYLKLTKRGTKNTPNSIQPVQAGDLKVGDRIWAPKLFGSEKRSQLKKNILAGTTYSNIQTVHRAYSELLEGVIPDDVEVHHKDGDPENNRKSNLVRMTVSAHRSYHQTERMQNLSSHERTVLAKKASMAAKNRERKLTEEERKVYYRNRSRNASKTMKEWWDSVSPEERSIRAKHASLVAEKKNTKKELEKRGRKGSASRWKDPEQHRRQSDLMKRLNAEGRLRPQNHKIVAVRNLPPESTYDFTVEDYHTALVGTGVLVHNCYGANAVHFSILQEYMAVHLGVNVGTYYQISDSLHVYDGSPVWERLAKRSPEHFTWDMYGTDDVWGDRIQPWPLVINPRQFDLDLKTFFESHPSWWAANFGRGLELLSEPFFRCVVIPMLRVWYARKEDKSSYHGRCELIHAADWRTACLEWCQRRDPKFKEDPNLGYR